MRLDWNKIPLLKLCEWRQVAPLTFVYFNRHHRGSVLFAVRIEQSLVTWKFFAIPGGMRTFWHASEEQPFIFLKFRSSNPLNS